MKTWLDSHSRLKLVDTDQWYLDLANHLLWVISESDLYREETLETQQQVAITMALYLEDCVVSSFLYGVRELFSG